QKGITTSINYTGTILACAGTAEYLSFSIDGGTPYLYTTDIFCGLTDTGGGTFLHIYPVDHAIEILSQVYSPGGYDYYANVQPNTVWVHTLDFNPFGSFSIHTELLEWNP